MWLGPSHGCAPQGALGLGLSRLDLDLHAEGPRPAPLAASAGGAVTPPLAVGAGFGEIAVLAPGSGGAHQVLAGRAGARLKRELRLPGGGPAALARAYLGDVAAAAAGGGRIRLALRRYLRHGFRPRASFGVGRAPVTALALALDYRSEVLVAWEQSGTVYARLMRNWGRLEPIQRLGTSEARPALQAMLSDNGHAMVAWATGVDRGRTTTLQIALSDAHTRFGEPPRRIAAFEDPAGIARRPASFGLVRLAGENVLLAWTVREGGRYRVLGAPAVFAGVRPSQALSPAGRDATLDALVPGPANEALAAWKDAGDATGVCSVVIGTGDRVLPCTVQDLPEVRSTAPIAAAVDPGSDRPVLAWRGGDSTVSYLTGSPLRDYRAHGYAPAAGVKAAGGVHWLRITAVVVAAGAACAAVALLARRRRRTRPG